MVIFLIFQKPFTVRFLEDYGQNGGEKGLNF